MVASIIRDMFCFVVFTIGLSMALEGKEIGKGIYGILFASPISDVISGIVIITMTISFFKKLGVEEEEEREENPVLAYFRSLSDSVTMGVRKVIGYVLGEEKSKN